MYKRRCSFIYYKLYNEYVIKLIMIVQILSSALIFHNARINFFFYWLYLIDFINMHRTDMIPPEAQLTSRTELKGETMPQIKVEPNSSPKMNVSLPQELSVINTTLVLISSHKTSPQALPNILVHIQAVKGFSLQLPI